MSAGRVTIRDVAAAAGVSRQTVSNALIHPERLKGPTLERVQAVIRELGYRPSNAAQSLRSQRTGAVGFELLSYGEANRNEVAYPFTVALGEMAIGHGCHLVTFSSAGAQTLTEGYADMVRAQVVDAFVLADTHPGDPRPDWLDEAGVPYAAFGRLWGRDDITSWADVDGAAGLADATAHLLDAGYERIGYLGWPHGSAVGDDRRAGWATTLVPRGYPAGPEGTCEQDLRAATMAAYGLLDQVGRGGAIACASDLLAVGVERAARDRGWRPGIDVGITGVDDSGMAEMFDLTTVAQPLTAIADYLLGLVHKRLEGGPPPEAGALFRPTLVTRASSRSDR
ncbi:MAG: LacI family DNA-binding transcriptional regulator [Dermatophilaceae bacterium]